MFILYLECITQYSGGQDQDHKTWVVLNFKEILNHFGWLRGEKWEDTFVYFNKAWEVVLKWLGNSL